MATLSSIAKTCLLCQEIYVEPKKLLCEHSFCKKCINRYVAGVRYQFTIKCPVCARQLPLPVDSVEALELDCTLAKDAKCHSQKCKNIATISCETCAIQLCEKCIDEFHQAVDITGGHKVNDLKIVNDNRKLFCSEESHSEQERKIFCQEDDEIVCDLCARYKHSSHQLRNYMHQGVHADAITNLKEQVQVTTEKLDEVTRRLLQLEINELERKSMKQFVFQFNNQCLIKIQNEKRTLEHIIQKVFEETAKHLDFDTHGEVVDKIEQLKKLINCVKTNLTKQETDPFQMRLDIYQLKWARDKLKSLFQNKIQRLCLEVKMDVKTYEIEKNTLSKKENESASLSVQRMSQIRNESISISSNESGVGSIITISTADEDDDRNISNKEGDSCISLVKPQSHQISVMKTGAKLNLLPVKVDEIELNLYKISDGIDLNKGDLHYDSAQNRLIIRTTPWSRDLVLISADLSVVEKVNSIFPLGLLCVDRNGDIFNACGGDLEHLAIKSDLANERPIYKVQHLEIQERIDNICQYTDSELLLIKAQKGEYRFLTVTKHDAEDKDIDIFTQMDKISLTLGSSVLRHCQKLSFNKKEKLIILTTKPNGSLLVLIDLNDDGLNHKFIDFDGEIDIHTDQKGNTFILQWPKLALYWVQNKTPWLNFLCNLQSLPHKNSCTFASMVTDGKGFMYIYTRPNNMIRKYKYVI